jgi:hypothetical protein
MDYNRWWYSVKTILVKDNMETTKKQYPAVDTYFIAWNSERTKIEARGLILTTQVMETNWQEVDYYEDKNDYEYIVSSNEETIN